MSMMRLKLEDIGGGRVLRSFQAGDERLKQGTPLTAEFLRAIPRANLNVLMDKNFIQVWPKAAAVSPPATAAGRAAERHVVSLGFGRYHVVEGVRITDAPVTKEKANELAGIAPEAAAQKAS